MSKFLLEIYSEEIPSRMQQNAIEQLYKQFYSQGFRIENAFISPCRMVIVGEIFANQDDCFKDLVLNSINGVKWPKLMQWSSSSKWIRPIRSILCLVDDKIIDFSFMGVKSDNYTFGHKTLSSNKLEINSVEDYFQKLEDNFVIVDQNKRKNIILDEVSKHISSDNVDMATIDLMVGLTEYPCPCIAEFPKKFLDSIPKEVILVSIKHHQKCLVVSDKNGNITNQFINTSNVPLNDNIISGYQRVLNTRLGNAEFLYKIDLAKPLYEKFNDLEQVMYYQGLGSLRDKSIRISNIAEEIAPYIDNDPKFVAICKIAGLLSKADLVSNTVREFPELQGVIGYYLFMNSDINQCMEYIKDSGLVNTDESLDGNDKLSIALSIKGHYYPQGGYSNIDSNYTAVVALADKIDTLSSFWSIGQKPTGSKDPFALRRMCIGVIKILLEQDISLDLGDILSKICSENCDINDLLQFIQKRIEALMIDQYQCKKGYIGSLLHLNNPVKILSHYNLMKKFNDFSIIISAYKRLLNFFKGKKINVISQRKSINREQILNSLCSESFNEDELSLMDSLNMSKFNDDILEYFNKIALLVNYIFDKINIGNDNDKLILLKLSLLTMYDFADFSKIEN